MYHHNLGGDDSLLSSRAAFPLERRLLLQGGIIPGDSGLVLSTDAKPRLKWTPELHDRFIEAVNQLGGPDKATPKTVMRVMGIPGLTLYHLKSHLQKYRLSKNLQAQACSGITDNSCNSAVDRMSESSGSVMSNTNIGGSDTNKTMHISEAIQMQIEVQRQLREQLEVQRHLQLRIEAQGKYLQSVLEKAQETLGNQTLGSARLEATKGQLSELVSKVSNECLSTAFPCLEEFPGLHILQAHATQITDCSMDSCLTSCEGSRKDRNIHNVGVGLRTYHGSSPLCTQHTGVEDIKISEAQLTWSEDTYKNEILSSSLLKASERPVFQVQRDPGTLSMSIKAQKEKGGSSVVSEARRKESSEDAHLEQPNSKRPAIQQERGKPSGGFGLPDLTAQLDLNAHNSNDADPSCEQFDLNGYSWS